MNRILLPTLALIAMLAACQQQPDENMPVAQGLPRNESAPETSRNPTTNQDDGRLESSAPGSDEPATPESDPPAGAP